jgi:hypothetical protein
VNLTTRTFVTGLIAAVLVSCVASVGVTMMLVRVIQGPKGDTGPRGIQGPQGATGATGATGPQGPQGLRGDTGATGATGPTGPQGIQGIPGTNGANGTKWYSGTTAPSNSTGVNGDFYLNSINGDIYTRNDTSWTLIGNTKGGGFEQLTFITLYASDTLVTYVNRSCYEVLLNIKNTGTTNVTINTIFLNDQPYNSVVPTALVPGGIRAYQVGIVGVTLQPSQSLGGMIFLPLGTLWNQGTSLQITIETTSGGHYPYTVVLPTLDRLEFVSIYADPPGYYNGTLLQPDGNYFNGTAFTIYVVLKNTGTTPSTISGIFLNSRPYDSAYANVTQRNLVNQTIAVGQTLNPRGLITLPRDSTGVWTSGSAVEVAIKTAAGGTYSNTVVLP